MNSDKYIKNYKNSLGFLLFKKIYTFYFLFVSSFIIFQIYSQFKTEEINNLKMMKKAEEVYSPLIEKFYISENSFELKRLSETLFKITDISGISIESINNTITSNDNFNFLNGVVPRDLVLKYKVQKEYVNIIQKYSNNLFIYSFKLKAFGETYCKVSFYSEKTLLFNHIKGDIVLIIVNLLVGMVLLWLLFIYYSGKYLIKPLNDIKDATTKFDLEGHEIIEIKLDVTKENELFDLANTFNKMSKRINETYINMQQLSMIREVQKNKLEEQTRELIEANKSRDDFLANMSHELKTPLNSINLISDVMMRNKSGALNEKHVKNLEIINKCGKDLLTLINDILDLSKLEAGQIIVNNSVININQFADTINDIFNLQAKERGVDFIINIDCDVSEIFSDENRLKQIIKNLLSNAIKFTENGKVTFDINSDDKNIYFIISDDGIGIPEDKLEHIFDRFKQVDGSTTRKYGGTGLGLAISKELANLLEGDIILESKVDVGSKFTLKLPKKSELITVENHQQIEPLPTDENTNEVDEKIINEMFIDFDNDLEFNKKDIYVYNNDPINFIKIIVELNNSRVVKQFPKLSDLIKEYKKNRAETLIDISLLNEKERELILNSFDKDLIVIYENELDSDFSSLAIKSIKKPFEKSQFITI